MQARRTVYPPGPRGGIPGAMLLSFRKDPIGFELRMAKHYGDIVHYKMAGNHFYQLNNPERIKEVLVTKNDKFIKSAGVRAAKAILGEGLITSDGVLHTRERRLIQPAFFHDRMWSYAETMIECTDRQIQQWKDGETLYIRREMMRLTLTIVAKALFGSDVSSQEADEIGDALSTSFEFVQRFLNPAAPILNALPLPSNRRFNEARSKLDAALSKVIETKMSAERASDDLLSLLLEAKKKDPLVMSDKQLRDEVMTLFLAGHETTANALTWSWFLLSKNPDKDAKLREELDKVLGGRAPTMGDVPQLRYARSVLSEALRLYPPIWILGREAAADCEVGGYQVQKGSIVTMSQFVLHHDSRFYESPEEFRPERWTEEMKSSLPKFAYFPFGGGPRACLGESFAWLEGILVMAVVARKWRLFHEEGYIAEILPSITLRPRHEMRMTAKASS